jgi:hypothetical protein
MSVAWGKRAGFFARALMRSCALSVGRTWARTSERWMLLACWPNRSLSGLAAIAGQKRAQLQVQANCNNFSILFTAEVAECAERERWEFLTEFSGWGVGNRSLERWQVQEICKYFPILLTLRGVACGLRHGFLAEEQPEDHRAP